MKSAIRWAFLWVLPLMCTLPLAAKTWFVRVDGGTRYSARATTGQCDGLADAAYPGHGTDRHCAFNDVRWMVWDGGYGTYGQWIMQGGDTLVIRGCKALPSQQNPDSPHCRVGWDKASGTSADSLWCIGTSSCGLPPPPSGTAAQHTRILGGCAFGTYSCTPVTTYPYTNNNLTQLFAGYGTAAAMYLAGSKFVDVEGLELTTHNGQCARYGTTHPLPGCRRGGDYPLSDQADQGISTDVGSSNILLQDVYIHGFSSNGISGAIGGPFTLTRVSIDFNAFAGWNFDDGRNTPNAPGSSITQSYVTMIGNGCQEEYPITHPQFPAKGCWDSTTGGFGDAWSGQESTMDFFTCDHCTISYNTKDGAIGPHTQIGSISLTNSLWVGNMGQAGKWGQRTNAKFLFQNNVMVGNCMRMSQQIPGAARNFDSSVNAPGSGLAGYCRAAGPLFDYFSGANSDVQFNNNTIVTYQPTTFEPACYRPNTCASAPIHFTNNLVLGFIPSYTSAPFNAGRLPALFYKDDNSVPIVASHNLWFGLKNDDGTCGKNGNLCVDPQLVNQPAAYRLPQQTMLDSFNYRPSGGSPANGRGKAISGLVTDFYGHPRPNPPSIGAVEAH